MGLECRKRVVLSEKNIFRIKILDSVYKKTNTLYIKLNYIFHTRVRVRVGAARKNSRVWCLLYLCMVFMVGFYVLLNTGASLWITLEIWWVRNARLIADGRKTSRIAMADVRRNRTNGTYETNLHGLRGRYDEAMVSQWDKTSKCRWTWVLVRASRFGCIEFSWQL